MGSIFNNLRRGRNKAICPGLVAQLLRAASWYPRVVSLVASQGTWENQLMNAWMGETNGVSLSLSLSLSFSFSQINQSIFFKKGNIFRRTIHETKCNMITNLFKLYRYMKKLGRVCTKIFILGISGCWNHVRFFFFVFFCIS